MTNEERYPEDEKFYVSKMGFDNWQFIVYGCADCGAVVRDMAVHDEFHERIDGK